MSILIDDGEVIKEIPRLEQELGPDYKVVNLLRSLSEIEAELADEWHRRFVRQEKASGARIALLSLRGCELWLKPEGDEA
ncbi:MAG TPA: hypothetical protein VF131_11025 [Blastocatellia bacterium]|nr:hypothetical protein [Blastocatellia bacterium]